jgi:predicted anti-sigma-YlaC factor YlaD
MLRSIPPSDCEQAQEAASARVDGELSAFEAARLDAHLSVCAECQAFAASARGIAVVLRGADLEQPSRPVFIARRRRPALRMNAAAAAATIVLAAASSFAVGQLVGSERGGPSATVGTTVSARSTQRSQVLGMLRRGRLGRMSGSEVIPV